MAVFEDRMETTFYFRLTFFYHIYIYKLKIFFKEIQK